MNLYDAYKPFRNKVKEFDLEKSLIGIWHYANHVVDDIPLPNKAWYYNDGYSYRSPKEIIFPWQLEIALKEIILNYNVNGKVYIDRFQNLSFLINGIQNTINTADGTSINQSNIFYAAFRLLHQQALWQAGYPFRSMMRHYEIFKHPSLSALLVEKYGLNTIEIFTIAHLMLVNIKRSPYIDPNTDYTEIGIPKELSSNLLNALTDNIIYSSHRIKLDQEYDHSWAYTRNHIRDYPLIKLGNGKIICPFPTLFLKRLTDSLYYDLVKLDGFSNPYGQAYENHIFNTITKLIPSNYEIKKETPYTVTKKNRKLGFDALIGSKDTCLLIECKTYRAPLEAKSSLGGDKFSVVTDRLSDAVVQACKNVKDIHDGFTEWDLSNRKIVVFIITLDPWFTDFPDIISDLNSQAMSKLELMKFDLELYSNIDYYICSADQFEKFCHVVSQVGLDNFFENTDSKAHSINNALYSVYASHGNHFPFAKIFGLIDALKERVDPYFDETQF
ncbi:hypothetical protein [Chromobacterium violaceum]|uniref:hypothetical protein n=1 Tax=Chromobacterium violaceum TaxID=536 RepID=UPI001C8C8A72|nr:hypothetical protein [Chromobacterium violaceum]MBX9268983.1 hypothetical protein [Chromobacterium violaceum]